MFQWVGVACFLSCFLLLLREGRHVTRTLPSFLSVLSSHQQCKYLLHKFTPLDPKCSWVSETSTRKPGAVPGRGREDELSALGLLQPPRPRQGCTQSRPVPLTCQGRMGACGKRQKTLPHRVTRLRLVQPLWNLGQQDAGRERAPAQQGVCRNPHRLVLGFHENFRKFEMSKGLLSK